MATMPMASSTRPRQASDLDIEPNIGNLLLSVERVGVQPRVDGVEHGRGGLVAGAHGEVDRLGRVLLGALGATQRDLGVVLLLLLSDRGVDVVELGAAA